MPSNFSEVSILARSAWISARSFAPDRLQAAPAIALSVLAASQEWTSDHHNIYRIEWAARRAPFPWSPATGAEAEADARPAAVLAVAAIVVAGAAVVAVTAAHHVPVVFAVIALVSSIVHLFDLPACSHIGR